MKTTVDIQGLDGVLETLKSLPPEVVSKRGGPVARAVRKGAIVIRDAARARLRAVTSTPGKTGINYGQGISAEHVIVKRGKPKYISEGGELYYVSVKSKIHTGSKGIFRKRPIKTNDIAFILEYGTSKQPPEPWLVPAFEATKEKAISVTVTELNKDIERIAQKLLKAKGA